MIPESTSSGTKSIGLLSKYFDRSKMDVSETGNAIGPIRVDIRKHVFEVIKN